MGNWKDLKGYEGLYIISDNGIIKRVARSVDRKKVGRLEYEEKIISQRMDKYGYVCVSLQKDGKRKTMLVHRLVIETFSIETPKKTVNHKDGIKTNNHISNLEWASISENITHAIKNGLRGDKTKPVYKYKNGVLIDKYDSIKEAAEKNNISTTSINMYCQGKRNSKTKYVYSYDPAYSGTNQPEQSPA